MKKKIFFGFVILSIISCSLPFNILNNPTSTPTPPNTPTEPADTPTARVEVIYRLPEEMNLHPQDVPELTETEVEQPAQEPLLPEAVDQDQVAYSDPDQDINIESNVIMVPGKTVRTPEEIADVIIKKRRPDCKWIDGDGGICNIGERCHRKKISCGCGAGLVTVIIRSNIIVIIIGCGRGVKADLIDRIGGKIDDRIKAPAPLKTPVPPKVEVLPIETSDICSSLNLTAEECINSGLHTYSCECQCLQGCYVFHCGTEVSRIHTILYTNDGVVITSGLEPQKKSFWKKISPNSYYYEDSNDGDIYQYRLNFTSSGFSILMDMSSSGEHGTLKDICTLIDAQDNAGSIKPFQCAGQPNSYAPQSGDQSRERSSVYDLSAQIQTLGNNPPAFNLLLKGSLPTPCHKLRVSIPSPDSNNRIMVDVYSVEYLDPSLACVQKLEPFDAQVPLCGFPPGQYSVFVNGSLAGNVSIP